MITRLNLLSVHATLKTHNSRQDRLLSSSPDGPFHRVPNGEDSDAKAETARSSGKWETVKSPRGISGSKPLFLGLLRPEEIFGLRCCSTNIFSISSFDLTKTPSQR